MKSTMITLIAATVLFASCGQSGKNNQPQQNNEPQVSEEGATVYLTREITPESLVRVYKALGDL